jgi:hypothetical protein
MSDDDDDDDDDNKPVWPTWAVGAPCTSIVTECIAQLAQLGSTDEKHTR